MRIILVIGIITVGFVASCTSCNPPDNANRAGNTNANPNNNGAAVLPTVPPEPAPSSTLDPNFKECNSYYPLIPGSQARYSLLYSSGLQAKVVVAVDQKAEGGVPVFVQTLQIVDNGAIHKNETTVQKYVCDNGRIKIIAEDRDNTVEGRKTMMQMHYVDPAYVMLEAAALKPGATWSYSFTQTFQGSDFAPTASDRSTNPTYTVVGQEELTVPAGKYKVIKVTKTIGKTEITEYYAAGIGLVKRVAPDGTTWELMSYSGLKARD